MPSPAPAPVPERERRFYLEQFTGRTLVIGCADTTDLDAVDACAADLVAAGVRVVQVIGRGPRAGDAPDVPPTHGWRPDDGGTVAVWRRLRAEGHVREVLGAGVDGLAVAAEVARRLRATKLVLLDPTLPRPDPSLPGRDRPDSYATLDAIAHLAQHPWGLAATALRGGVPTVNLCHPADVAEELLTYAGAGTCVTTGGWVRVERVGIDDFAQVAQLIRWGVEEGYLKPRSDDALARLVVNGYGARVGDHHLAGFAALLTEPYAAEGLGEVCALTTISRFAGGGVGASLVRSMLDDARASGLRGVFACTAVDAAARFFARLGFAEVDQVTVPLAKWEGYDEGRRPHVRAFLHDLGSAGS